MRTVVNSREVTHLWAHQTQDEARSGSRGSMSFSGRDLYSYTTVIARHVTNKRGQKAVLMSRRTYSVTTAKHLSYARQAASHLTVFYVDEIGDEQHPRDCLTRYSQELMKLVGQWRRARTNKPWLLEQIKSFVKEGNAFAEFYGLKGRLGNPEDMASMELASRQMEAAAKRAKEEARRKREKETRVAREKWLAGESAFYPAIAGEIRLRIKGDELQTSRGASVPLSHAVRLFKIILRIKASGKAYERNGHTEHIGHYDVDSIDENGNVKVGCHYVEWAEVERVAKQVPGLMA